MTLCTLFILSPVIPLLSLAASSTIHSAYGGTSTLSRNSKYWALKSEPMADFTQYCESTWIRTPNSPAKLDPACWNQHDSNIVEGWHLGFKSLVQCTSPTLCTFLDALKLEQRLTDQKIADRLMLRQKTVVVKQCVSLYNVVAKWCANQTCNRIIRYTIFRKQV